MIDKFCIQFFTKKLDYTGYRYYFYIYRGAESEINKDAHTFIYKIDNVD